MSPLFKRDWFFGAKHAGLALDAFLELVYGRKHLPDRNARDGLERLLGKSRIETLTDVRAVTMALDRQSYNTPMIVRLSRDDVRFAKINGIECPVDLHDSAVSIPAATSGEWERHLVECFRRICLPGSWIFDIGANVGYHTLLLATLAGESGTCVAFEPNSENCRLIAMGCEHNKLTNVQMMPIALSDQPGWAYFSSHIGSNGGFVSEEFVSTHGYGTVVPVFALDALGFPRVDVIKIDVEGAEYRALRGGEQLIRSSRPAIVSELSIEMLPRVSRIAPLDYFSWITGMDYEVYLLDRASAKAKPIPSVTTLLDGWGTAERIEDLLFMPTEKTSMMAT